VFIEATNELGVEPLACPSGAVNDSTTTRHVMQEPRCHRAREIDMSGRRRIALSADDRPDGFGRLVPDRPQPMRQRTVERKRIAGSKVIDIEANLDAEPSAQDVSILLAGVPDK
jgi:hypothetical protein